MYLILSADFGEGPFSILVFGQQHIIPEMGCLGQLSIVIWALSFIDLNHFVE
jgi:hypothetical protein